MNEIGIKLENVSKSFKQQWVLEDVNMNLEYGKIYGLVGRNGSGKSVLIKMISGLISPTEGKIEIGNVELKRGVYASDTGIVLDSIGFLSEYTARENLQLLAGIRNIISDEEINCVLDKVGLNAESKKVYKS